MVYIIHCAWGAPDPNLARHMFLLKHIATVVVLNGGVDVVKYKCSWLGGSSHIFLLRLLSVVLIVVHLFVVCNNLLTAQQKEGLRTGQAPPWVI